MTTPDAKTLRDITSHLARIATALERIADALEAANANDPVAMIAKAMGESEAAEVDPLAHIPPEERFRFG